MSDAAPESGSGASSAGHSLAARDAAGVMLGLAALLERRTFDPDEVDPRLIDTTVRRLRRVGAELMVADHDERGEGTPPAPPDGVAWATQLAWLLGRGTAAGPVTGTVP